MLTKVLVLKFTHISIDLGTILQSLFSHKTLFSPPLPDFKVEAINNISIGVVSKIILSFDKRWWSDEDVFFGFMWSKEDKEQVPQEESWTTRVACANSAMGSDNVLVLWANGATARHVRFYLEVKRKVKVYSKLPIFMPRLPQQS